MGRTLSSRQTGHSRFPEGQPGGRHGDHVHVGQRPEIELTSESTATGMWWLNDYIVMQPNVRRRGYAFYEDEYVKETANGGRRAPR